MFLWLAEEDWQGMRGGSEECGRRAGGVPGKLQLAEPFEEASPSDEMQKIGKLSFLMGAALYQILEDIKAVLYSDCSCATPVCQNKDHSLLTSTRIVTNLKQCFLKPP